MKITKTTRSLVEVDSVRIALTVRYGEDVDAMRGFPFLDGEDLDFRIALSTGRILDWPPHCAWTGRIDTKISDMGSYWLMYGDMVVASIEENYVPSIFPEGGGDYIELKIGPGGVVLDWREPSARVVEEAFAATLDPPGRRR